MKNKNGSDNRTKDEQDILQNIKLENFEGALNNIIKMMNVTEKQKVKRVEVLSALEKKVARRLQKGQINEAIEELRDIIDDYKRLGLFSKAEILELTLNELISEIETSEKEVEHLFGEHLDEAQVKLNLLEARAKKAIRRFIQGKTDDGVMETLNIIEEFRQLNMEDRAKALEDWMYQFLDKQLDQEDEQIPLSERLEFDPELQDQLLSYRTQRVLKKFIQEQHRKAVEEYMEIVNEYKSQGRLEVVETLEIWFNLFITKTYLLPSPEARPKVIAPKPPAPSRPKVDRLWQPPIKIPESLRSPPKPPTPKPSQTPTFSPQTPAKPEKEEMTPPTDAFKEKITKIKNLLQEFEDSLD